MPIACLMLAALAAFAIDAVLQRSATRRVPRIALAVAVAVLLLADLHVRAFRPSSADASNQAYAAVRAAPPGRLLELPIFTPDIHYGSVYFYYDQQVRRQRPAGYSTTAPRQADEVARQLQPLGCGDWTTGAGARLAALGVSTIALHRGLYVHNPLVADTSWLAWRGLVQNGWRPVATDGPITTFTRGRSSVPPPFGGPAHGDALFCEGWYRLDSRGHQMRRSHAAFWVYGRGIVRLFLASPTRIAVSVSLDGRPDSHLTVLRLEEVRVGVPSRGWHLLALDTGRLPVIGGRPRGVRVVAYTLPGG